MARSLVRAFGVVLCVFGVSGFFGIAGAADGDGGTKSWDCERVTTVNVDADEIPAPSELCEADPISVGEGANGESECRWGGSRDCSAQERNGRWFAPCPEGDDCPMCHGGGVQMPVPTGCQGLPSSLEGTLTDLAELRAVQSEACDCGRYYGSDCSGTCYVDPSSPTVMRMTGYTLFRDVTGRCRVRASFLVGIRCTGYCSRQSLVVNGTRPAGVR